MFVTKKEKQPFVFQETFRAKLFYQSNLNRQIQTFHQTI